MKTKGCMLTALPFLSLGGFLFYAALSNPFLPMLAATKSVFNQLPPGYIIEKNAGGYYRCVNTTVGDSYKKYLGFEERSYNDAVGEAWRWYEHLKDDANRENNDWRPVQP